MNDIEIFKMLGQSGIAVGALWLLARIVMRVGERMIAAIDRVGSKMEEHTKIDVAHHQDVRNDVSELRTDVAVLSGRVGTIVDRAQSFSEKSHTPPPDDPGRRR